MALVIISRTSSYEEPPIKGATLVPLKKYDKRTCSLAEAQKAFWWSGFVAGVEQPFELNGQVRGLRKNPSEVWMIEVGDVFEFVRGLGERVIVNPIDEYPGVEFEIEIYDDYRE